jgi:N-acetylglutamate synthase-like GNAT family acetyltransferase
MLRLSDAPVALLPAAPGDWPAVLALLEAAGLPTADLQPAPAGHFLVARADDPDHRAVGAGGAVGVVGAIGVEAHGPHGLLRSLVVDPAWRGRGVGSELVAAAEQHARAVGLQSLTLLTQSASAFFAGHGYAVIARAMAPVALLATPQFAALCPASSTCMTKTLHAVHP